MKTPKLDKDIELTILMPCLNEVETLENCIKNATDFLSKSQIHGEVLIADNGSDDGSQRIAEKMGARLINVKKKGYGSALLEGINHSHGKYIIMGDADSSYNFRNLSDFICKLRSGYQLVMGNRFRGGIAKGAMPFLNRYIGNPILSFFGNFFFKSKIRDFHCGLRGFDKEAVQNLNLVTGGMEFASEMVVKATLANLKITEVPTTLDPDGRSRAPHLRRWRDGWRHLRFLLLFCPQKTFFYPGIAFFLIGGGTFISLLISDINIDGIIFGITSLLYSSGLLIIGFQLLIFYFIAGRIIDSMFPDSAKDPKYKFVSVNLLELGLFIGSLLIILGCGLFLFSVVYWGYNDFLKLDPTKILRVAIPSVTLIVLGGQMFFSSFFLFVLVITGKVPNPQNQPLTEV